MSIREAQQKKKSAVLGTQDHPQYISAPNMEQMVLEVGCFEHSEVNDL